MKPNALCTCAVLILLVSLTQGLDVPAAGAKMAHRLYVECARAKDGFSPCLKKRAIAFVDRLNAVENLPLAEGLHVVRTGVSATQKSLDSLEATRSLQERDAELTDMLIERVANYFNTRTVKLTFPPMTSEELGRSIEEGRGKMKKMMGMMMMGFAMKMAAMIPIAIAGLFVLAGKALIISKIALLLAGIIGLKKLLSSKQGGGGGGGGHGGWSSGGGGGGGGWSSGGGGGGGGWDRRSFSAQELAYNAHVK